MAEYRIPYGQPTLPKLTKKDMATIEDIINSGWVSNGRYCKKLEELFKATYGVKHALTCNNATNGLIIAFKAAEWEDDRIAMPAFTWPSTLYAANCANNDISWLDIDPETWLASLYMGTGSTKWCVVDTFGNQFEVPENRQRDFIIDAAHGWDLPDLGRRALVEVVSFSFTKLITGTEGGMILTNNDKVAENATELRRLSSRMSEVNAYLALRSIQMYDTREKTEIQVAVDTYLNGFDFEYETQKSVIASNNSVFAIKMTSTNARNAAMVALAREGIETKVYYDPLNSKPEVTKDLHSKILAFPTHALAREEQENIISIVNQAVESCTTPGKKYLQCDP
jgi:dTDP-4-amino-4,6-dideoxygalactose transaminase